MVDNLRSHNGKTTQKVAEVGSFVVGSTGQCLVQDIHIYNFLLQQYLQNYLEAHSG
jgi:hypothetical protein